MNAVAEDRAGPSQQSFHAVGSHVENCRDVAARFSLPVLKLDRFFRPTVDPFEAVLERIEESFSTVIPLKPVPHALGQFRILDHEIVEGTASRHQKQIPRGCAEICTGRPRIPLFEGLLQKGDERFLNEVFRLLGRTAEKPQIPPDSRAVLFRQCARIHVRLVGLCGHDTLVMQRDGERVQILGEGPRLGRGIEAESSPRFRSGSSGVR